MKTTLPLTEPISRALSEMKFEELTEIQERSIPIVLKGEDLIAQARTGTGKTAAFAIPILERAEAGPVIQAIVLVPTRELAIQVGNDFRRIGKFTPFRVAVAYGGTGIGKQIELLKNGAQIVVGTPGRVQDLIERRALNLSRVRTVVLDEADVMLAMGFARDVERILSYTPAKKQTLLFCVDLPDEVLRMARKHLRYPQHVKLVSEDKSAQSVTQYVYRVEPADKLSALIHLLKATQPTKALIFCRTKHGVKRLVKQLALNGVYAHGLQGNMSQTQRDRAMAGFKSGEVNLLVATDIASRGIHIDKLSHVFNYELPHDINYYVHRIGRTGRMYAVGEAITLCSSDEAADLRSVERLIGHKIEQRVLPPGLPRAHAPADTRERDSFQGRGFSHGRPRFGGGFNRHSVGRGRYGGRR